MLKAITPQYKLISFCSLLLTVIYNTIFFEKLRAAFPLQDGNLFFFVAVSIFLLFSFILFLSLIASRYTTKLILSLVFFTAAIVEYYMSSYGTVIDHTMLQNALETDPAEIAGICGIDFYLRIALLGLVPIIFIWSSRINYYDLRKELRAKGIVLFICALSSVLLLVSNSANFATFIREYKQVRYYVNPTFAFYSAFKLGGKSIFTRKIPTKPEAVSVDAVMDPSLEDIRLKRPHRELVILVVGETARVDRFQLNGYHKETNPLLSKVDNLVSFTNVTSCGTSTAVSVPCMFSKSTRKDFKAEHIKTQENALDVLQREGVNIIWLDNNSSSKGVADRLEYKHSKRTDIDSICDSECRDEGMLLSLQKYIDSHPTGDILIVLHTMGSHGPEYYKRYPESFEFFKPACKTKKLASCTQEEVNNAYDNTIRYTDYFLNKTIEFLKLNDKHFEAAMMYLSDHGESLGEGGAYLHGLPYFMAPETQTKVPVLLWTGEFFDYQAKDIIKYAHTNLSHDNLYCTLLQMFEVETADCKSSNTFLTQH